MKKRALFVGLTVIDIQYFVDEFPLPNQKVKTTPPLIHVGGPAANAAITFSFMGGEGQFITGIGDNSFTRFIHDEFSNHPIEIIDFAVKECFDPIFATVITSMKSSERSIISHYPCSSSFQRKIEDNIKWDDYDIVFTDGFYPEIALPICKIAKEKNLTVILDGGSWKPSSKEFLPFIDIAICSEQFFPPGCHQTSEVIQYLHQNGISKIAITRGENSILWSENNQIKSIEVFKTNSIDSLAAGDIFHGAFSWYMLEKSNFETALCEAAKIASFSTRFKGAREWMKHFNDHFVEEKN